MSFPNYSIKIVSNSDDSTLFAIDDSFSALLRGSMSFVHSGETTVDRKLIVPDDKTVFAPTTDPANTNVMTQRYDHTIN